MRVLAAGLQDHLASGATTLCWCWRITRNDAVRLGFTDHDRDLGFDGSSFEASTGFTATEIDGAVGLNVDSLDVQGALTSDSLTEDDLSAGLFDNAVIEIYRVNWQDCDQRVLMRYGNLGEVSRGQYNFKAEVRGLAHELQQTQGRTIQFPCDADLGDARCTVNLAPYTVAGAVTAVADPRTFIVSGLNALPNDFFTRGLLTWTSGMNAGRKAEVKLHTSLSGSVTLELWSRMADTTVAGDNFSVSAGCDKQFATCRTKFTNVANFRGFPHVPGNDFLLSVASKSPSNDGGSMNS